MEKQKEKGLKEIIKYLGKEKALIDKDTLYTYSYDATGKHFIPEIVVIPENEDDVKRVLKTAFKYKIPITPRGAGVGYSGGALPLKGGIVMTFTRMRGMVIDAENSIGIVEPGVVTADLQKECEKQGLFYPPDPASLKTSTIGGNVAENAGGPRCFKYGVTGNYVLGLEGFFIDGEKFSFGGSIIKDVAGYNLKSLLVGSEGTLAIITKIFLRLIPKPEEKRLYRIDFKTLTEAAKFINLIIKSGINPSVIEFMDRTSLSASINYLGKELDEAINASLIVEIDGNREDVKYRDKNIKELLDNETVFSYKLADNEDEEEEIWEIRRNISPSIAKLRPKKINEDIVVPIKEIPETVAFINNLADELDLLIIIFGHFGDGNIHTNIMIDPNDEEEVKRSNIALDKIFKFVIQVGGSISGEHGIGISKQGFMYYQFNEAEMKIFKNIKKAFDSEGLLNPGKMF